MKALIKFALAAVMLITTLTAQAGGVRGHYRSSGTYVAPYYRSDSGSVGRSYGSSSGYVYRNPYAAYPSVSVRGFCVSGRAVSIGSPQRRRRGCCRKGGIVYRWG